MLRPWISLEKINWDELSINPHNGAVHLLKENPEKINWVNLCQNTNKEALNIWYNNCHNNSYLYNSYLSNLQWYYLSSNSSATQFLSVNNQDCVNWKQLSLNPAPEAITLLNENHDKINWSNLSANSGARSLLLEELNRDTTKYSSRIDWNNLCLNPCMMDILENAVENEPEKINWNTLSFNSAPEAITLLIKNPEKINWKILSQNSGARSLLMKFSKRIDWSRLCKNPSTIDLLETEFKKNPDIIHCHWSNLSSNPAIFMDWNEIEKRPFLVEMLKRPLKTEIIEQALHPRRITAIYKKTGSLEGYI